MNIMNRIDIKHNLLSFAILCLISLAAFSSCSKEDSIIKKEVGITLLKANINGGESETKTLYSFADNKLKVKWIAGDQIAVSNGSAIYKFTQTGTITDNGHSALFAVDEAVSFPAGTLTAIYPYSTALSYDFKNQSGTLESLPTTDILSATATVSSSAIGDLSFSPLCTIFRFAKGTLITDADYSGALSLTFSGDNVGGAVKVALSGGITITPSDIKINTKVTNGKLDADLYLTFAPISKTNQYTYYLETDKNDIYGIDIENIATTELYLVKELSERAIIFEDLNFEQYCVENFDTNGDGKISYAEAKAVTIINVNTYQKKVKSLKGIRYFKNLEELYCCGDYDFVNDVSLIGDLTSLDIQGLSKLKKLYCGENKLASLNISGCTALIDIECAVNQLTSLDLTDCPNLTDVHCAGNLLTEIDVSKNPVLGWLTCHFNQITSIDISKNSELYQLECSHNPLTSLNLKGASALKALYSTNTQLATIDLSENPVLKRINLGNNQLTSIDINNNPNLEYLYCSGNQLTSLDLSKNSKLETLYCHNNKLTTLDVSPSTAGYYYILAWPQEGTLNTLYIKNTGVTYFYKDIEWNSINPSDWGTTIVKK